MANQIPDYDAGNLSRFERNISSLQLDKIDYLALALRTTAAGLFQAREIEDPNHGAYNVVPTELTGTRIPIVSWVLGGFGGAAVDNFQPGDADDWVTPEEPMSPRAFALRVRGNSMSNPDGLPTFPEGIVVMVEPDIEAKTGDFVIVRCNGDEEATFKQLTRESGRFYLTPLNPRYPVVELPTDAVICGVVREAQFKVR
ncbi:LexA family protein [Methylibium sp.]|uniref:LexA family protein n=1 Tax=Methylibium sp. TaxID=2067992 RepID=UPI003D140E5E